VVFGPRQRKFRQIPQMLVGIDNRFGEERHEGDLDCWESSDSARQLPAILPQKITNCPALHPSIAGRYTNGDRFPTRRGAYAAAPSIPPGRSRIAGTLNHLFGDTARRRAATR